MNLLQMLLSVRSVGVASARQVSEHPHCKGTSTSGACIRSAQVDKVIKSAVEMGKERIVGTLPTLPV